MQDTLHCLLCCLGGACREEAQVYAVVQLSTHPRHLASVYRSNHRSARSTVADLQRRFPRLPSQTEGRYDALTESTVRNWFDDNGDLKEKYKSMMETAGFGYKARPGSVRVLAAHADVEQRIKGHPQGDERKQQDRYQRGHAVHPLGHDLRLQSDAPRAAAQTQTDQAIPQ